MDNQVLRSEADFADAEYAPFASDLAINPGMFRMYSEPRNFWEFREVGSSLVGDLAGKTVLDFGCGMGEEAMYFAKLDARVTAIDISPVGIDITRHRARFNGLSAQVDARLGTTIPTDLPDASFDVVHGLGILHYVGLDAGLKEVTRLLKPGGKGIFFEWMGNSEIVEKLKVLVYGKDYEHLKSDHEAPLEWDACVEAGKAYPVFKMYPYYLTHRLHRQLPGFIPRDYFKRFDHELLTHIPALKHFASGLLIYLEK